DGAIAGLGVEGQGADRDDRVSGFEVLARPVIEELLAHHERHVDRLRARDRRDRRRRGAAHHRKQRDPKGGGNANERDQYTGQAGGEDDERRAQGRTARWAGTRRGGRWLDGGARRGRPGANGTLPGLE